MIEMLLHFQMMLSRFARSFLPSREGEGGVKSGALIYQLVYIELTELPSLYLETLNRMISQLKIHVISHLR